MGQGISTDDGSDPLARWALRIGLLPDARLTSLAEALLGGLPIETVPDQVTVGWNHLGGHSGIITLRVRDVAVGVEVAVTADPQAARDGSGEPRSPLPIPRKWVADAAGGAQRWELFNARLTAVRLRPNP